MTTSLRIPAVGAPVLRRRGLGRWGPLTADQGVPRRRPTLHVRTVQVDRDSTGTERGKAVAQPEEVARGDRGHDPARSD